MKKSLRPYQQKASDVIHKELESNIRNQLLVMATGTGKTFTAIKIIEPFKKKLWITHTEELMEQSGSAMLKEMFPDLNLQTMIDTYGGLTEYLKEIRKNPLFHDMPDAEALRNVGIVKAQAFDIESDIVIASAQTLHRRLDRIAPDQFDAVVADEAHLFGAKTFVKSLNYFQPKLLLGLTATPFRADGVLMGDIFDKISFTYRLIDAIKDGYLVELDAIQVKTDLSLDDINTVAGELNQKQLRQTVDNPTRNRLIVEKYKAYADGKQNIVYCVDMEHAMNVRDEFRDQGYTAECIVSDENITTDRKGTINRFKNKEIQIVTNCMILTAGFDYPELECITLACPTKSLTKFIQQVGRGTRALPGVLQEGQTLNDRVTAIKQSEKPKCIILDVVDVTSKHRLINTFSLDKAKKPFDRVFTTTEKKDILEKARQQRIIEATRFTDSKVNLLSLPKVQFSNSIRMKEDASQKQLDWLRRLGYDVDNENYTKEMANKIISNLSATSAQIKFVEQLGYNTRMGVTRAEAALAIEEGKTKMEKAKLEIESQKIADAIGITGLK